MGSLTAPNPEKEKGRRNYQNLKWQHMQRAALQVLWPIVERLNLQGKNLENKHQTALPSPMITPSVSYWLNPNRT